MPIALDSNVLLYFHGVERTPSERAKIAHARLIVPRFDRKGDLVLPTQVLGETYRVLTGKGRLKPSDAYDLVEAWRAAAQWEATTPTAFDTALNLATRHGFQIWDALIIAVSAEAGCDLLLSEDMQNGFTWRGLTIVNPFAAEPHPRLAALLG